MDKHKFKRPISVFKISNNKSYKKYLYFYLIITRILTRYFIDK